MGLYFGMRGSLSRHDDMGLGIGLGKNSYSKRNDHLFVKQYKETQPVYMPTKMVPPEPKKSGNPNPSNFTIKRKLEHGDYSIVWANYPDCFNYEGNKIMVFKGEILYKGDLDPHFFAKSSLVARFLPTEEGWNMAIKFVKTMV